MKTLITVLTATAVLTVGAQRASAGHHDCGPAAAILTGLVVGGAVAQALAPAPTVVYAQPQVVYSQPQVVYSSPPVYAPPAPAPVYVAPAPVVVYAPPVYYPRPYYWGAPLVSFRFGVGGGYYHGGGGYHHGGGYYHGGGGGHHGGRR